MLIGHPDNVIELLYASPIPTSKNKPKEAILQRGWGSLLQLQITLNSNTHLSATSPFNFASYFYTLQLQQSDSFFKLLAFIR